MPSLIRQSLTEFHKVTGLTAKLVPATAPRKPIRFGVQDNEFCRRVWTSCEGGCVDCHHTQQELFRRLDSKLKPQLVCCAGGIVQLAIPVMIAGKHVATVIGGKVRLEAATETEFRSLATRLGFPEDSRASQELRRAYFDSPVLTPARFREALRLLDTLARFFGEALERQTARADDEAHDDLDAPYMAKARAYVKDHMGENLTTRGVARALNLSESYFCRLFHRFTGTTFRAYLAQARVDSAKHRLLSSFAPITEICYVSGFQSVSDFNRVFKARVGTSPSKFRRAARNKRQRNRF